MSSDSNSAVDIRRALAEGPTNGATSDTGDLKPVPLWRRPSPLWVQLLTAFASVSTAAIVAPKIEIYTRTLCKINGVDESLCLKNPEIQAGVAQLITVFSTASGILSAMTTAWWGSLSDRYGRQFVMGFNLFGLMVSDISFLIVAHFGDRLPGGHWLYVIGPCAEGMVGAISSASAIMHAYVSDCTEPADRSRAFARLSGLIFVGMSVGPFISGFIMRVSKDLFPIFYISVTFDAAVALTVWFLLPESLPKAKMQEARRLHAERISHTKSGTLRTLRKAFDFISPLGVFLPEKVVGDETGQRGVRWDYGLTLLGAAFGCTIFVNGSIYQQVQYAQLVFGWTSENASYWIGGVNVTKAIYLTILFPILVQLLSMRFAPQHSPVPQGGENEPLLLDEPQEPAVVLPSSNLRHRPALDLFLARLAVVTDLLFFGLIPAAVTGSQFAVFSMCTSLGTSFSPVMNSLALELYGRRGGVDTGRLLGALTVVSAVSSHIIGPTVFGTTFMKTVASFPGAIYLVCCAALTASLVMLLLLRLRPGHT